MSKENSDSSSRGNGYRRPCSRRLYWRHRRGGSIAVQRTVITEKGQMPPIQMTLNDPSPRNLMIVGPDDRPLAGVRLAPIHYEFDGSTCFRLLTIGWTC